MFISFFEALAKEHSVKITRSSPVEPEPGVVSEYEVCFNLTNTSDVTKLIEKSRIFYGNDFEVSYAYNLGLQQEEDGSIYIMVRLTEPRVIPGHNFLKMKRILDRHNGQ